jgi:DNA-binding GntR family transcriptional regulator
MIEDYRRLEGLLARQRDALKTRDFETLRSLHEAIERLSARLSENDDLTGLQLDVRRELECLIRRIAERIRENQSAWQEAIEQIQQGTNQLRARRRYYSAVNHQPPGGTRYSRTG